MHCTRVPAEDICDDCHRPRAIVVQVYWFPAGATSLTESPAAFAGLAVCGVLSSFTSTLMFTALGSFFNRISDPDMGGAYLTLLNTIANMGVILPKIGVFAMMDLLTRKTCQPKAGMPVLLSHLTCTGSSNEGASGSGCAEAGGECVTLRDGFYPLSYCMVLVGVLLGIHFQRTLPRLEALPLERWRARPRP